MNQQQYAWWDRVEFEQWRLYLVATDLGLSLVTLPHESFGTVTNFLNTRAKDLTLFQEPRKLEIYKERLLQYFQSEHPESYPLSYDLRGSEFQISVWRALLQIPYGQTRSYSEIADMVGRPNSIRAVARAVGDNPIPFLLPCHRVIGKDGSLRGYRGGLPLKQQLLQMERQKTLDL